MMECCIRCFNDNYIIKKIESEYAISDCDYCGAKEVSTVPIEFLADDFENLFTVYEQTMHGEHYHHELDCPTDFGSSLEDLIQDDWNLFSDETNQNMLLFDILNFHRGPEDYLDCNELYSSQEKSFTFVSSSNAWEEFTHSIKRKNRYFPEHDLSKELETLLPNRSVDFYINFVFYRARIGKHLMGEMGPPPAEIATSGRVNPKGIPYLYVASDQYTCIAETRPWIGAKVTVAKIHTINPIKIIDLSSKKFLSSPFLAEDLSETLEAYELLNRLSHELSKPINPDDSDVEYIPTQYLAELIKNLGYDGLSYKSTLGSDRNFVFFYPDNFTYEVANIREILAVEYDFE